MNISTSTFERAHSVAEFARRAARWTEYRLERARFDVWHAADAGRAYDVICGHNPSRRLDGRTRRRIDAYAREVFGSRRFAPWLRAYAAFAGEFREGWMPDNYYGRVVHERREFTPARLCRLKTMSRRVFESERFPDVAYQVGGVWLDVDGNEVEDDRIDDLVFAHGPRAVAKFDASKQGLGVHVVRQGEGSVRDLAGQGDFVIQRFVRQAPFFDRFTSDTLATIRITTVRTPTRAAHTRAHYLKFGRDGQRSYTSARGVLAPIVDASGTLGERGTSGNWHPVDRHPDSGEVFGGRVVPCFAAACRVVEALHDKLPQVETIGWDVAVTDDDEILIIEWNAGHADITFTEATIGPSFTGLGWEDRWRR